VPELAVSVTLTLVPAFKDKLLAVVLVTCAAPVPPLIVKLGVLRAPPVALTPVAACNINELLAVSPDPPVRVILPAVEWRVMFAADSELRLPSVKPFEAVIVMELLAEIGAPEFWTMPPCEALKLIVDALRAPATVKFSAAPDRLTPRIALAPLTVEAFKVTTPAPPVAVSVIDAPVPPAPDIVIVVALVEALTAPLLPFKLMLGALSDPPLTDMPFAPLN